MNYAKLSKAAQLRVNYLVKTIREPGKNVKRFCRRCGTNMLSLNPFCSTCKLIDAICKEEERK